MVGHGGQSPPSHGLGSSRTIPTASALTPTGCRNHPRNEHYIVKNFTLKGKDGACGLPGTLNSCASSLSCRQPSDVLPVLGWLPGFLSNAPLRSTLSDVVCGVTVAAVVVPQGMAYGMLAGVPPVYGLYTAMLPPLVYTLLGSCMHLAVGPFALISMLTAAGVQEVVPDPSADPAAAVAAAGVIALFSGLVLVALGILRLGFIATFLSDPVLSGYSTAVSVIIPTSQLKYAFQVHGAHGSFIQTIIGLVKQISEGPVNFFALGIFVVSAILILLLQTINRSKRLPCLKKFPIPAELLVVVLSTAVCRLSDSATGVSVLGRIEKGLPPMQLPQVSQFDLDKLISSVLIVSLMTYITAMSVSKTFARKFGYEVDNNQELLALGCANIIGSLSSSFPAAASFSRTAIVGASGAATPLHNLWTVAVLALVLLFCGPLIETLPHAALAAIVAVSFKSLLLSGFEEMRKCWRVSIPDFIMWSVAFWSTLLTNVTIGIAIAVGADVLFLFWKSTMPSYSVLGRLRGTERLYRSRHHFVEAEAIRGLMIFRFDESLHFANREVFATKLRQELRAHDAELNGTALNESVSFWNTLLSLGGTLMNKRPAPQDSDTMQKKAVTAIILDFSPISHIDISGIRTLEKLRAGLAARGTRLVLAHCKYMCYQKLSSMGFFEGFEGSGRFDVVCFRDLHDAVLFAEGRLPMPVYNEDADGMVNPMGSSLSATSSMAAPPCLTQRFAGSGASPTSLMEYEAASPQLHHVHFSRQTTEEWLSERGVAVGFDERGHHEQVHRSLSDVDGQAASMLPTLLSNASMLRGRPSGGILEGVTKVRRASSEGDLAELGQARGVGTEHASSNI